MIWLVSLPGVAGGTDTGHANDFEPTRLCPGPALSGILEETGAEWLICMPDRWNGNLVLFEHGTVAVTQPGGRLEAIQAQLQVNGTSLPALINQLGFGFMVGARPKTGLSVVEGISQTKRLAEVFEQRVGSPAHRYVVGASLGGIMAAQLVEDSANDRFDGGLAACGPIGSFREQLRYGLDFMVLFEYFFRSQLRPILQQHVGPETTTLLETDSAGNPQVPEAIISRWPTIKAALLEELAKPERAGTVAQVLRCANIPTSPSSDKTPLDLIGELLDEYFLELNDAIATLGGSPVDNQARFYFCPHETIALNRGVKRFRATEQARQEVDMHYETSGRLHVPLITLHNVWDHRVPFWHEIRYWLKAESSRLARFYSGIPLGRAGHCAIQPVEALAGFALLIFRTTGVNLTEVANGLLEGDAQRRFGELVEPLNLPR